jgi:hypothetical protein
MTSSFERRLRDHRRRALVRAWEYRQRAHAHGVWYRLRRVLTRASAAHIITCDEVETLVAEGYLLEPVGDELQPPKRILFVPAARIARIPSARPVAVRLSAELLSAECLALTPFEPTTGRRD